MKLRWWDWLPFQPWRVLGVVEGTDEIPERLPARGAVVVGDSGLAKWVAFDCACGRGHRIMLNTDPRRRPVWRVTALRRRLSIAPSIDFSGSTMRCHYFIRDGQTVWARD